MEQDDRPLFVALIETLAAGFGRPVDEAMLDAYWMGLSDLPLPALTYAVSDALRDSVHMPPVATLRKIIRDRRCKKCDRGLSKPSSLATGLCEGCRT